MRKNRVVCMLMLGVSILAIVSCEDRNEGQTTGKAGRIGEVVDLGLSVQWADCNVGADSPEDYGGYYAWGESSEKNEYEWSNYKWCDGKETGMTKYCTVKKYGVVDGKNTLDATDDVAHVKWGDGWRMPTLDEFNELNSLCSWTWTSQNGVNGYRVTGPNGNSIFLPAAGYRYGEEYYNRGSLGYYWSGTLSENDNSNAYRFNFNSGYRGSYDYNRYDGFTVRPVRDK